MVKRFGKDRKLRRGGKGGMPGGFPGGMTGGLPKKFKFKGLK